jgi:hypothetical protein
MNNLLKIFIIIFNTIFGCKPVFSLPPELKCAIDFFTTFAAEIKLDLTWMRITNNNS